MAFHNNWIGLFEAIAGILENARCWREAGIFMAITGLPMSIFNAAIVEDEQALTAERLPDLARPFEVLGLPYSIQLRSEHAQSPFETLFREASYVEMLHDPMMVRDGALDLPPLNPAITLTSVESSADRRRYSRIIIQGFNLMASSAQEFIDIMLNIPDSFHVIAWRHGETVGAGSLLCCGGVAGVYNVTTLPGARRQGVGVAVMDALHTRALTLGYPGTALASSAMGLPFYNRLGYRLDGYQLAYVPLGVPV